MLRATFKSLLAHKLRLVLSAIAVILGVAFVAGSFVFTDTIGKTFDDLFTQVSADVTVAPKPAIEGDIFESASNTQVVPAAVVETVRGVDGVADARGDVQAEGVNIISKDGKVLGTGGAPGIGVDWSGAANSPLKLTGGQQPEAAGEIAIDTVAMEKGGFALGDSVRILLPDGPPQDMKLVGVFRFGTSGNLAGATLTAFEPSVAQQLLLEPGMFSSVSVTAAEGVSQTDLKARIAAALPTGYEAKTKDEQAAEASKSIGEALGFINTILLAFAGVALFVGSFIILNTFSMIVAQRTRELALLRAIGASRGQVRRSMLLEALVIGLLGSAIGIAVGVGLAKLLQTLFAAAGLELSTTALVLAPRTVVISLVVGVVVTVLAAYLPARRAAKVAPIAAMRDAAAVPKSMAVRGIVGGLLTAVGALALVASLTTDDGSSAASLLGLGVLVTMIGAIVLAPLLGKPIVRVLGAPFRAAFGSVGRLSTDNAERNPRRTAATASALMIGLALVTGFGVLASSISASIDDVVERQLGADFIASNSQQQPFSSQVAKDLAAVDGVESIVRQRWGSAKVGDEKAWVVASDADGLAQAVNVEYVAGSQEGLADGGMLIDDATAESTGLKVGQTVPFTMAGGSREVRVVGVVKKTEFLGPYVVGMKTWDELKGGNRDSFLYVNLADGADATAATAALNGALGNYPTVTLQDQTAFKKQQHDSVNQLLMLIYGLLALAVLIAVLGIINTLALSVIERTREIGLMRAVGLSRRQLRRMVILESVVIALLGAVLGLVLGLVFGTAAQRVLAAEGIEQLSVPLGQLIVFVVVAAVIGVLAALWPARRAARLDVLRAITTE